MDAADAFDSRCNQRFHILVINHHCKCEYSILYCSVQATAQAPTGLLRLPYIIGTHLINSNTGPKLNFQTHCPSLIFRVRTIPASAPGTGRFSAESAPADSHDRFHPVRVVCVQGRLEAYRRDGLSRGNGFAACHSADEGSAVSYY